MVATLATTVETCSGYGSSLHRRESTKSSLSSTPLSSQTSSQDGGPSEGLHHVHSDVLAELRTHVLSYLADLETHLGSLEHPLSQLVAKGESKMEEARAWISTGIEMLEDIRADVSSHLPELHPSESVGEFVKLHMHINDINLKRPLEFVPTLSQNLHELQLHLSSYELPQGIAETMPGLKPHPTVHELIDLALAPKFIDPLAHGKLDQDRSVKAVEEIHRALRLSSNGASLILYDDLPEAWKSNAFVTQGYRCVCWQ
jgi:adiponectin receptor